MPDFVGMFILKNERRHVKVLRIHMEWHWEGEILKHFKDDSHWMHSFFLNQVGFDSIYDRLPISYQKAHC